MNLKRLEHLVAVVEEGTLAAAARRVNLTQPALTRSIQTLEDEAGMALFDRGARGVTLTSTGRMVLERARRILFEASCLERDLQLVQQHEMGIVRFGLGPFPAAILLARVLGIMQRDWPNLRVSAEVNSSEALFAALQSEQLDFVLTANRLMPLTVELEVRPLMPEPIGFFVRPLHPLCGSPIELAQIREARLASVPLPVSVHELWRTMLRCRPGEDVATRIESNDFRALAQLARHEDVVLIAPNRALEDELASGTLVQLSVEDLQELKVQYSIAYLAQRTLSPAAEKAIATIEAVG
ncbi:LysR family transcriptional regulator [Paraburkholderia guartelaensis]|uniref:LysR family transcriptional regulator n=1 Tax=Paraburkholderia guartelaensis TaxID=2546446 RepID=UPI002AB7366A|nr:LysR family transcriptional regulator [Paraburkholderia guartelaensis]